MRLTRTAIVFFGLFALTTYAAPHYQSSLNFLFWYNYGKTRGFSQIPAGGGPGTTSPRRPYLNQLGVDRTNIYNLMLAWHVNQFKLYGGYQFDRQSGHSRVTQLTLTHATTFPAGANVRTRYNFDLARIGIAYFYPHATQRLIIYPAVEWTLLNFRSSLTSPGIRTQRDFDASTVRFGSGFIYNFSHQLAFNMTAFTVIPNLTQLDVYTVAGRFMYLLAPQTRSQPTIFLGMRWQRIRFQDHQRVPNYIKITEWPLLEVGIKVKLIS
ncbi:MAG: hypothetical protein AAGG80_06765 [Pseudomonadota bacterium]